MTTIGFDRALNLRLVVGAGALVIALAACHSGSKGAAPTTAPASTKSTATTTTATTTTATGAATSTPSASTTTAAPTTTVSPVPRCRSANLRITASEPSGAAGTEYFELQYRNAGPSACEMTGYPGVSFLDAAGGQIGVPAQRSGSGYASVTDPPGATVFSAVGAGDPDVRACPAAAAAFVRVYPPNETQPVRVALAPGLRVCASGQSPGFIDPVVAHAQF